MIRNRQQRFAKSFHGIELSPSMPPANNGGSDYGARRKADTQSPISSLQMSNLFVLALRLRCMPELAVWNSIKYRERGTQHSVTSRPNAPVPMWKSPFWLGTSAVVSITSSFATRPNNWLKNKVADPDGLGADLLGRRGAEVGLKLASERAWAHCYDLGWQ